MSELDFICASDIFCSQCGEKYPCTLVKCPDCSLESEGTDPIFESLIENDLEPLFEAIEVGKRDCLGNIASLEYRDNFGLTPLIYASLCGNLDMVSYLVKLGANVNARDSKGFTPLLHAANEGQYNVFRELVCLGSSLDFKINGYHWKTYLDEKEIEKLDNIIFEAQSKKV